MKPNYKQAKSRISSAIPTLLLLPILGPWPERKRQKRKLCSLEPTLRDMSPCDWICRAAPRPHSPASLDWGLAGHRVTESKPRWQSTVVIACWGAERHKSEYRKISISYYVSQGGAIYFPLIVLDTLRRFWRNTDESFASRMYRVVDSFCTSIIYFQKTKMN